MESSELEFCNCTAVTKEFVLFSFLKQKHTRYWKTLTKRRNYPLSLRLEYRAPERIQPGINYGGGKIF